MVNVLSIEQLPGAVIQSFIAGSPWAFNIDASAGALAITSPELILIDISSQVPVLASGPAPTVASKVVSVAFSASQTAALNTRLRGTRAYAFSVRALVGGQGPYELAGGELHVKPRGSTGTSTATTLTLPSLTVGAVTIPLTITLGGVGVAGAVAITPIASLPGASTVQAALEAIQASRALDSTRFRRRPDLYNGVPIFAYGHSYVAGVVGMARTKWVDRLKSELEMGTLTNNGVSGQLAVNSAVSMLTGASAWTPNTTGMVIIETGINDNRLIGNTTRGVSAFERAVGVMVNLARAASLAQQTTGAFTGGGWTQAFTNANASGGTVAYNTNVGQYVEFTVSGTEFTVGTMKNIVGYAAGTFVVKEGSTVLATFSCDPGTTGGPAEYAPILSAPDYVRITGLSSGSHTIRIECTVAGTIWVDYITVPMAAPPTVVLVADPHLADYSGYSPYNIGSTAAQDAYTQALRNVAALYPTGEVIVVDANSGWTPATMVSSDDVHPNDRGAAKIAATVADALMALDYRNGCQLVSLT